MSRHGRSFAGDAFHEVAIAADGIAVVIEQFKARLVEMLDKPAFGNSHSHAVAHPLSQRSSGGLCPGYQTIFRMSWCLAVQLAKGFDLVQRDGEFVADMVLGVD